MVAYYPSSSPSSSAPSAWFSSEPASSTTSFSSESSSERSSESSSSSSEPESGSNSTSSNNGSSTPSSSESSFESFFDSSSPPSSHSKSSSSYESPSLSPGTASGTSLLAGWAELESSPYVAYSYSYPHKTAYRKFSQPYSIDELWREEKKDSLFLYVHIPFCEMRCGFCNLFTVAEPNANLGREYIDALVREAEVLSRAVEGACVSRMAIGGGTPSFLEMAELQSLFDLAEHSFVFDARKIPISFETSPQTVTRDKLKLLYERGVDRISIGVQSFADSEVAAVGRAQKCTSVETALTEIRGFDFNTLNIDLIYGLPDQSKASFIQSIERALQYRPEEIYLYPLYVRSLTGLGRQSASWSDERIQLYREGRDRLLAEGYVQLSMRMFQLPPVDFAGPLGHTVRSQAVVTNVTPTPQAHGRLQTYELSQELQEHVCFRSGLTPRSAAEQGTDGDASSEGGLGTNMSFVRQPVYCCQTDGMLGLGSGARSYTTSVHYSGDYAVERGAIRKIISHYMSKSTDDFRSVSYGYQLDRDDQVRRFVIQSILQVDGLSLKKFQDRFGSDVTEALPELVKLTDEGLLELTGDCLVPTAAGIELSDSIGVYLYSSRVRELMQRYEAV